MTSSKAFRCVQAWLLEKPAAWADEDASCLAAALMAQRPSTKRPREDALLEAERSHQRRRILEERLRDLGQVKNKVDYVSEEAVYGQAARPAGRACPALV